MPPLPGNVPGRGCTFPRSVTRWGIEPQGSLAYPVDARQINRSLWSRIWLGRPLMTVSLSPLGICPNVLIEFQPSCPATALVEQVTASHQLAFQKRHERETKEWASSR